MMMRIPDETRVILSDRELTLPSDLSFEDGKVSFIMTDEATAGLKISIQSKSHGLRYLILKWHHVLPEHVKVLGDAWERGYGDLRWLPMDPARVMPWYMAASNGSDANRDCEGRVTQCFGVGVLPNCFALWSCDTESVTLTLDLRCGAAPLHLDGRTLECCTVYAAEYTDMSAFHALRSFCGVMSPRPLLSDHPVYGSNNWYYAYGKSSHDEIVSDTRLVASLCEGLDNKPYMVIDDGWQPNMTDAPWDRGNERFPDMERLAAEMASAGVRPGIWVRYLINGQNGTRILGDFPDECYTERCSTVLDPSHPRVLDYVRETTSRLVKWGYTLIKHDYSTFDLFGKWGMQIKCFPAEEGDTWGFYDRGKTSAEIIKGFHRVIREAAGNAVIIGCNVMGHLCAGLHHCNRTGDDTSGRQWIRTLKMGVNTLAFRQVQNNIFFAADADCVGILGLIEWKYNRQWLELLSRSGSPLFVSCKPDIPTPHEFEDLRVAYAYGSKQADELIPLDWMETPYPARYLLNGTEITFDWGEMVKDLDPTAPTPY
jgi:alpha-galactosidase